MYKDNILSFLFTKIIEIIFLKEILAKLANETNNTINWNQNKI